MAPSRNTTSITSTLEPEEAHALGVRLIEATSTGIKKFQGRAVVVMTLCEGPEGRTLNVEHACREEVR